MEQNKKRGLGRGLSALIPTAPAPQPVAAPVTSKALLAPLASIAVNPWQPRRQFSEVAIDELADSIRERGIVQPLVVRPKGDGYELIAGERRLRAATKLGLESVPISVRETSDAEMLEIALIENIQRQDLNAIEEALAYKRLIEELGLKQDEVAARVGKERSTVANSLRLLQLPPEIRQAVEAGQLSAGHARAIAMAGSPAAMMQLFRRALAQKLSVRATERMAKTERPAKPADADVRDLEERLTKSLGTKVRLTTRGKGAGSITIDYFSLDQLDGILKRLGL